MQRQKINCTVYDCKHCDPDRECCNLKQIKVACCRADDEKESTMCDNYKKIKWLYFLWYKELYMI